MASWGYEDSDCPPHNWHTAFPIAKGNQQSPIDLKPGDAKKESLPKLNICYQNSEVKTVENSGRSVTFHLEGKESKISGGPLTGSYKLVQFHFHWGSESSKGSEHTLEGVEYAAELHLVHQNEKYATFAEAIGQPDGLSVIGVFLKVGDKENQHYQAIAKNIGEVRNQGDKCNLKDGINIKKLLPKNKRYLTYPGSLTTPTLNECVTWINILEPVVVSETQIAAFRCLTFACGESSKPLMNNYRQPQPLHDRQLTLAGEGNPGEGSDSD